VTLEKNEPGTPKVPGFGSLNGGSPPHGDAYVKSPNLIDEELPAACPVPRIRYGHQAAAARKRRLAAGGRGQSGSPSATASTWWIYVALFFGNVGLDPPLVKCTLTTTELNSENTGAARIKAMTEKKTIGAFRKLTSLKESLDPTYRQIPQTAR
jgi:hypothetical protein